MILQREHTYAVLGMMQTVKFVTLTDVHRFSSYGEGPDFVPLINKNTLNYQTVSLLRPANMAGLLVKLASHLGTPVGRLRLWVLDARKIPNSINIRRVGASISINNSSGSLEMFDVFKQHYYVEIVSDEAPHSGGDRTQLFAALAAREAELAADTARWLQAAKSLYDEAEVTY